MLVFIHCEALLLFCNLMKKCEDKSWSPAGGKRHQLQQRHQTNVSFSYWKNNQHLKPEGVFFRRLLAKIKSRIGQLKIFKGCQEQNLIKKCYTWPTFLHIKVMTDSDVIIPGLLEFPENREFPGIQSNFPGIFGNLVKAAVFLDFRLLFITFWVQMPILSLFLATLIPYRCNGGP